MRFVLLALLLLPATPAPAVADGGVEIVYLANEGFLLQGDGAAVLVDALFGSGIRGYPAVPEKIRGDMERGEPPFEEVGLVLATHHHGDHFDPDAVARFLVNHPEALFVSTEQAVARLGEQLPEDSPLRARIRAAAPGEGRPVTIEHGDLEVEAFELHHGHGMDPPVQNLGFVIEIGGVRLLHVGDTEVTADEYRASGAADRRVDVALLSYWTLDRLGPLVGAGRNVVMHLPAPGAPRGYFAPQGNLEELIRSLREQEGDAFVPTRAMEGLRLGATP